MRWRGEEGGAGRWNSGAVPGKLPFLKTRARLGLYCASSDFYGDGVFRQGGSRQGTVYSISTRISGRKALEAWDETRFP